MSYRYQGCADLNLYTRSAIWYSPMHLLSRGPNGQLRWLHILILCFKLALWPCDLVNPNGGGGLAIANKSNHSLARARASTRPAQSPAAKRALTTYGNAAVLHTARTKIS